jgi:hypothetical protein
VKVAWRVACARRLVKLPLIDKDFLARASTFALSTLISNTTHSWYIIFSVAKSPTHKYLGANKEAHNSARQVRPCLAPYPIHRRPAQARRALVIRLLLKARQAKDQTLVVRLQNRKVFCPDPKATAPEQEARRKPRVARRRAPRPWGRWRRRREGGGAGAGSAVEADTG